MSPKGRNRDLLILYTYAVLREVVWRGVRGGRRNRSLAVAEWRHAMPLEPDGLPRGSHALHVYPHGKLRKHLTLINEMLPLINILIDRKDVREIDLGRIVLAKGGIEWECVGIRCMQQGRKLQLTCTASKAIQFITVMFLVGTDLEILSETIHRKGFEAKL